jgi:hypothetical protein
VGASLGSLREGKGSLEDHQKGSEKHHTFFPPPRKSDQLKRKDGLFSLSPWSGLFLTLTSPAVHSRKIRRTLAGAQDPMRPYVFPQRSRRDGLFLDLFAKTIGRCLLFFALTSENRTLLFGVSFNL